MLRVLLGSWKRALSMICSTNVTYYLAICAQTLWYALARSVRLLALMMLFDVIWLVGAGESSRISHLFIVVYGLCTTVVVSVYFFLQVRRAHSSLKSHSVMIDALRVAQWVCGLILAANVIMSVVFSMISIDVLPTLPWAVQCGIAFFLIVALLFWLDSAYALRSFFASFERSINFVWYNLPFFVLIAGLQWGIGWLQQYAQQVLCVEPYVASYAVLLLCAQYMCVLLYAITWVMLMVFYAYKKDDAYATYYIELS